MGEIPEWLKPYSKQGAYTPTKEDIEKLEPQSRDEMLLKYLVNSVSHDLSNYYTKSEVDNLVDTIPKFDIKVVQVLPVSNISPTTVYLLTGDSETGNLYDEYIYVDNKWELIGTQTTDLSNYYNKTEVDNLLSAKVNSSDLSTVATSGSYNDLSNKPTIPTKTSDLTNDSNFVSSSDLSNSYYTKTQTDNLLNLKANTNDLSTVATSGSYNDLSNKPTIPTKTSDLTNDSNFVSSSDLSNSYYSKTQTDNLLDTKVDKITGKGLSTEDYTTADKTKLAGIESEANKTVVVQTTGSSTTDVMSQNAVSTALNNYYNKTETDNLLNSKVNTNDLSTVATSGSYNDLSNKPTNLTDFNGTLPILQGGTGATTAISARTNLEVMKAYTLYSNASGIQSNITLSSSSANYNYIEIYYKNNDNRTSYTKVYDPNGKYVSLFMTSYYPTWILWRAAEVYIYGTSLTWLDNTKGWAQIDHNGYLDMHGDENLIYITRVVGYSY